MAKVLIIDDDAGIREMLEDTLKLAKHEVDTAVDGRKAKELYDKNDYQVIITDIIMPAFLFTAASIQGAMQPLDQTFRRRLRTQIGAHHRDGRPLLRIATGFGIETLMPTVTRGFNAFGIAVLA